ncbi:MAG: hypothetical protein P1U85_22910, partial [Verrucomicrobiales bacterium]|nr:hypothetical protein [Verrucomicrobiales bacterium]
FTTKQQQLAIMLLIFSRTFKRCQPDVGARSRMQGKDLNHGSQSTRGVIGLGILALFGYCGWGVGLELSTSAKWQFIEGYGPKWHSRIMDYDEESRRSCFGAPLSDAARQWTSVEGA